MASDYSGDDDDAWDFDLLDDILRKAEAANAAKRASQAALTAHPSSVPPQPESFGTSNFTSQVSYSNSGLGGPDSGHRQGEGPPHMGRGWQHSSAPVRTPVDTVRSTGYHVTQPAGPRSGMGSPQQNIPDRVAGGFASPQPSSVGNMHNRANHSYGNFTNSLPTRYTGYENMPPPGPSPLGRQPLSQAPSGGAMLNLTSSEADEEKKKLREELAGKTGAVSLLKSRLSQADKEIFELKTRTGRQSNGQSGVDQARELNRLSSELLFKDQELLEARRAKAGKDEQLKGALASAAALKEELEALKRDRRNVVDEEHKEVLDRKGSGNKNDSSTAKDLSRHEQEHDVIMEGEIPRSGRVLSEPVNCHPPSLPAKHMYSSPKEAKGSGAKMQTSGGESVKGKEKAVDLASQEEVHPNALDVEIQRLMDLKHSLEHIWGLKGPKDDGVAVIPKLYAACSKEVHTLLNATSREQEGKLQKDARPVFNPGGNRKRKGAEVQGPAEPEDSSSLLLHNAISKVANRLASPSALLGPLLSFCKMTNVELVFCALHTLRHLLIHDSSSRDVVMDRKGVINVTSERETEPGSSGSSNPLEPPFIIGKQGWSIVRRDSMAADSTETETFPVFSSPRIACRLKGVGATTGENEPSTADQVAEQVDLVPQEGTTGYNASKKRNSLGEAEILSKKNSFTAWILDVASKTTSTDVQGEAAAIVHLLVAHSEPRVERIKFAFMLFDGSLAGLIRQAASPQIKLCAVKLVPLCLSCSEIYRKFCMSESRDQAQDLEVGGKSDLAVAEDMQVDGVADEKVEGGTLRKHTTEPGRSKADNVLDVLTALSSCLTYTGNSPKEYALRRRAVRALTFLVVSGEVGAATLIRRPSGSGPSEAENQYGAGETELKKSGGDATKPSDSFRSKRVSEKNGGKLKNTPLGSEGGSSSVALQLMSLIDSELDADEEEERSPAFSKPDSATERIKLMSEALSLLCRLTAHEATSSSILSSLTMTKQTMRLSVSVTNRLIRKVFSPQVYRSSELKEQYSHMAEQAEVLKKRILSSLPQPEEPQSSEKTSLGNP